MISLVIVNWNSGPLLQRCVASLVGGATAYEIVVVDNASEDFSLDFVSKLSYPVVLLRNAYNAGFAAACNRGWQASRGGRILFLNPDTESAPGAVDLLGETLGDPEVWAAGGKLVPARGDTRWGESVRVFPSVAGVAVEMLLVDELWPTNPWTGRYRRRGWDPTAPQEVDQPAGACLMVRRAALEELGGFDESFRPAWFEDVDLCRRIRAIGGRIVFEPRATFLHHGGSSLKHLAREAFLEHYHTNQLRYFRKHHGPKAAARVLLLVRTGLYLRALLSLVRPLVPNASRRASARTFWRSARHFARTQAP